jgi:hypothetical protein
MRRSILSAVVLVFCLNAIVAPALERQPNAIYHARREALAKKLNGGIAILFAANEPALEYQEYRQDEDFYYADSTGKLIQLTQSLPHTAEEMEAEMGKK